MYKDKLSSALSIITLQSMLKLYCFMPHVLGLS